MGCEQSTDDPTVPDASHRLVTHYVAVKLAAGAAPKLSPATLPCLSITAHQWGLCLVMKHPILRSKATIKLSSIPSRVPKNTILHHHHGRHLSSSCNLAGSFQSLICPDDSCRVRECSITLPRCRSSRKHRS